MFWTDIITGALLMLTGLLVDRHPRMISGINTMSNERLAKVDLDGLKRGLRNVLLIAGATMLLLAILTYFVHIPEAFNMIALFAVTMAIVVSFVLISKRYDAGLQGEEGKKERRKNWIVLFIVLLVFAAVIPLFFIGTKPASIEVTEEHIEAKSGMYNASIAMNDITEVNVLTDWPDFPIRTNGIATDDVGIGHFRKKGGESCMLFVCTDGGPLLEVRTLDGKLYYLNCATEEETMEMIAKVKSVIRSRQTTGYNDNHTFCPHGGGTSAISQARRRTLFAWEIAGQARNEGYGVRSVCQMKSKRR
ncbi:MAG: Uncharacterized protein F083_1895 [bacterium F083]|nr:MAG: Uncharacterized protein F083_1895 [bacterium F083]